MFAKKILIFTVLAFTVFACTKDEDLFKAKFELGGEWKTNVYNDNQLFVSDSSVDVYVFYPDTKRCSMTLYRDGKKVSESNYSYKINAKYIKLNVAAWNRAIEYLIIDNETILIKHYNGDWLTLHKE